MYTNKAADYYLTYLHGGAVSSSSIAVTDAMFKRLLPVVCDDINEITVHHLRQWQADTNKEVDAGLLAISTLHRYVAEVKRFFAWCVDEELLDKSPAERLRLPKLPDDELPRNISDTDLMLLLDAAYKSGPRDYAVLCFLANTGCRVSGLCGLCLGDLELSKHRATVREKGAKARFVYYCDLTANALRSWLVMMPRDTGNNNVFPGRRGPLTRSGIRSILNRLAAAAGVVGVCNPHSFRHAWARRALEDCHFDLGAVSHYLGHRKVSTTADFYNRWAEEEWGERISKRDTLEALVNRVWRFGTPGDIG